VYAALGTDPAGLGFVVRGDIATPSTVRARGSYYDAVNATMPNLYSVGVGLGRRLTLPYGDGSFSIVITRYAFHHLLDPLSALQEITRVCAPGGRILVVDAYAPEDPAQRPLALEQRPRSQSLAVELEEIEGP
jgi:SAM-dependent methyltransferase